MVEGQDGESLAKVSPFVITKTVGKAAGQVKLVNKTKSGTLFIEVERENQARSLMKLSTLGNKKVRVSAHRSLNFSKGVIRWRDLLGTPVEEITSELRGQGVTHVHQMTTRRDGRVIETATYVLTFDRPTPPTELKCAYQVVKVEAYIPSPMRCFKCQRFGHTGRKCNRRAVCGKCAKEGHTLPDCREKKPSCVNCEGAHASFSKKCPQFLEEREIQSVRTERKISIPEARKVVRASRAPVLTKSYAAAVTQKKSIGVQTEPEMPTNTQEKKKKRKRKHKKKHKSTETTERKEKKTDQEEGDPTPSGPEDDKRQPLESQMHKDASSTVEEVTSDKETQPSASTTDESTDEPSALPLEPVSETETGEWMESEVSTPTSRVTTPACQGQESEPPMVPSTKGPLERVTGRAQSSYPEDSGSDTPEGATRSRKFTINRESPIGTRSHTSVRASSSTDM